MGHPAYLAAELAGMLDQAGALSQPIHCLSHGTLCYAYGAILAALRTGSLDDLKQTSEKLPECLCVRCHGWFLTAHLSHDGRECYLLQCYF